MDNTVLKFKTAKKVAKQDDYGTPAYALDPLMPHLPKGIAVWECAAGAMHLANALFLHPKVASVIPTDIKTGEDFLDYAPATHYDIIITNPPYTLKDQFLERCYEIGKPFALLLPLTALEGKKRQKLYREHDLELICFDKRINFIMPDGSQSIRAWFPTAWFTWGLNIGSGLTFYEYKL